jgi:DNA-binding beta-propeller fold protein YncE
VRSQAAQTSRSPRFVARISRLLLEGTALALAACDEPTGTGDPTGLILEVGSEAVHVEIAEGWPIQACDVRMTISVEGEGTAILTQLTMRFFVGEEGEPPVDSVTFGAEDLAAGFGGVTFEEGDVESALLSATAPAPFRIEGTLRYHWSSSGRVREVTGDATCGSIVPAGTALPTLELLGITTGALPLSAGDVVAVQYRAAAPRGLWASGVALGGAFETSQLFVDTPNAALTRTAYFTIPHDVAYDVPLTVGLFAMDGALRQVFKDTVSTLTLVDISAPTVEATLPTGSFWAGELIEIPLVLRDNFSPRWVHWRLGSPVLAEDSVVMTYSAREIPHVLAIMPQAEWAGQPPWAGQSTALQVWATDDAGLTSDTLTTVPGSLQFHAYESGATLPIRRFGTPADPLGDMTHVVYDPKRRRLYASHSLANLVSTYDIETQARLASVPVPDFPAGMTLSPSGDTLIVTSSFSNHLALIRLDDLTPLTPVVAVALDSIGGLDQIHASGVAVTANGTAVVQVNNTFTQLTRTAQVDLATGVGRLRRDVTSTLGTSSHRWRRLATTSNGARIVIADLGCTRFYRQATDDVTPCVDIPWTGPPRTTSSTDGTRIGIGNQVVDADLAPVRTFPGHDLSISPDGQRVAYVVSFDRLVQATLADGSVTRATILPFAIDLILHAPESGAVIAVNLGSGQFVVVPYAPD